MASWWEFGGERDEALSPFPTPLKLEGGSSSTGPAGPAGPWLTYSLNPEICCPYQSFHLYCEAGVLAAGSLSLGGCVSGRVSTGRPFLEEAPALTACFQSCPVEQFCPQLSWCTRNARFQSSAGASASVPIPRSSQASVGVHPRCVYTQALPGCWGGVSAGAALRETHSWVAESKELFTPSVF